MTLRVQDVLAGIAVALVWGMGIVFAKAAIAHFPPILLMTFRFAVTALALVWFVRPPVALFGHIFLIALISGALQYSLTFTGLQYVDASIAVLIVQLEVPFLVLLGALFLKETPGLRKWLGIAAAFAGVALISGEPRLRDAGSAVFLLVAGPFAWAVGQVMVRRLGQVSGITLITWMAVFATPQLFVLSLILEDNHWAVIRSADWVVWGTVIYLGLIMTALGYGLWYTLVRRHPVSQVAPFLLLMPVFSVLGGVAVLGESLSLRTVLGGLVVVGGVAFIVLERAARPAAPRVAALLPTADGLPPADGVARGERRAP
jgi:O-acetylserine/cysteine efflux transporter